MSLLNIEFAGRRRWSQVGDTYEVTRKPRGLDASSLAAIPFASMADIPQGGAYAPDFTLKAQTEIKSGTYFERGDILVAKITPSFENGKQALTTQLPTPFGFATTEVIPLRPRTDGHDRRLLFFYLLHPDVRHHVAERMEGTTGRQRVPEEVLLGLPFPEFELEEQTAVSDVLETIQRLMATAAKSIQTAAALKHAAMRTLFTKGLRGEAQKETEIGSMPESWELVSIGNVFEIKQGLSLKGNLSNDGQGIPFLRTSNVYWGRIELQNVSRMRLVGAAPTNKLLRCGDLLVCEGGEIGRAATWNGGIEECLFQNHLHRLRPVDASRTYARFVMAWLEEGFKYRNAYEGAGNRTTIPNLSRARLAELLIPQPSPDEQREIVAILDAIDCKIDLHRKKCSVLDDLFKTLLHKLMTGEIHITDLDLSALEETTSSSELTVAKIYAHDLSLQEK